MFLFKKTCLKFPIYIFSFFINYSLEKFIRTGKYKYLKCTF